MDKKQFTRWFNRSFWRAFKNKTLPIQIPSAKKDRDILVERAFQSIRSARYAPSIPAAEIVINKGFGVTRTVPVFCVEDYLVFYFCIKELEDILCVNRTDNTFGGWSLGGQLRKQEQTEIECELTDYGRFSFNPGSWAQAFGEFNSLLFSQLETGNYSHVLQFDLSNFYDSIRLDTLERWIREEASSDKGWIIALLFYFLNQWNRRNTGLHPQAVGLPQDALADCSRILANYYLQKYDQFAAAVCNTAGALYFRYSDDQMILLNDPSKVDGLLLLLTRNLDKYGLRVNQKKVDLWTADELQEHRCRKIQAIFANKGDNKDPVLVREFVDAYLAIPQDELVKLWNQGKPLLNRLLWANLESLPKKLFEKIIVRLTAKDFLLLADHKKIRRIHELNLKRTRPINLPRRLKSLGRKSVHNSFHYEALTHAAAVKDKDLKKYLTTRLKDLDTQMWTYEIK